MADDERVANESSSEGAEWDVSSLTSSAYGATSFPRLLGSVYVAKHNDLNIKQDPFPGLFMSDHFVFPPSEHENLPIEPEFGELNRDNDGHEVSCAVEPEDRSNMFCEEKKDDESDRSETASGDFTSAEEPTSNHLKSLRMHANQEKDNRHSKSDLPCQAWWKRHSASLYRRAKEANKVWSIMAAAALMGFVILGQRWQQDKWQLYQYRWQFNISNERMGRFLGPISRLKDGLLGGHRLRSLIQGGAVSASL